MNPIVLCLLSYSFLRFVSATWGLWLLWFLDRFVLLLLLVVGLPLCSYVGCYCEFVTNVHYCTFVNKVQLPCECPVNSPVEILSSASFLTGGLFECDPAHRRSVAVLSMLNRIRCNLMHALYDGLPEPYVLVNVTRIAAIAHRYTFAPPRC